MGKKKSGKKKQQQHEDPNAEVTPTDEQEELSNPTGSPAVEAEQPTEEPPAENLEATQKSEAAPADDEMAATQKSEAADDEMAATQKSEAAADDEMAATQKSEAAADDEMAATQKSEAAADDEMAATQKSEAAADDEMAATQKSEAAADDEMAATQKSEVAADDEMAATQKSEAAADGDMAATQKSEAAADDEMAATQKSEAAADDEMAATQKSEAAPAEKNADEMAATQNAEGAPAEENADAPPAEPEAEPEPEPVRIPPIEEIVVEAEAAEQFDTEWMAEYDAMCQEADADLASLEEARDAEQALIAKVLEMEQQRSERAAKISMLKAQVICQQEAVDPKQVQADEDEERVTKLWEEHESQEKLDEICAENQAENDEAAEESRVAEQERTDAEEALAVANETKDEMFARKEAAENGIADHAQQLLDKIKELGIAIQTMELALNELRLFKSSTQKDEERQYKKLYAKKQECDKLVMSLVLEVQETRMKIQLQLTNEQRKFNDVVQKRRDQLQHAEAKPTKEQLQLKAKNKALGTEEENLNKEVREMSTHNQELKKNILHMSKNQKHMAHTATTSVHERESGVIGIVRRKERLDYENQKLEIVVERLYHQLKNAWTPEALKAIQDNQKRSETRAIMGLMTQKYDDDGMTIMTGFSGSPSMSSAPIAPSPARGNRM